MRGVGIETRRCANCQNLQDVIAIDGAITIFFRCEVCNSETFLHDRINKFTTDKLMENQKTVDTT